MNYKSWKRNRVKYLIFLNKDVINEIPLLCEEQETASNASFRKRLGYLQNVKKIWKLHQSLFKEFWFQ